MTDRAFTDDELMTLSRLKGADLSKLTPEESTRLAKLRGGGTPDPSQGPEPDTYWGGFGRGLKQYGEDLVTGHGSARGDAVDSIKKVEGSLARTANPLNIPENVLNFVTDPNAAAQGLADTAHGVANLDPEAVGSVLGMIGAPGATEGALRGTNKVATLLRDSPKVRAGVGTLTGLGVGGATGHIFMGPAIGRTMAPLLQYPARALSGMTEPIVGSMDKYLPGRNKGPIMEPYAPNKSGVIDRGVDQGHMLSDWMPVDPYAPNKSGYPHPNQPESSAPIEGSRVLTGADQFAPEHNYQPSTTEPTRSHILTGTDAGVEPTATLTPSTGGLSDTDRATLRKQYNMSEDALDRMDRQIRGGEADRANRTRNAPYGNGTILPSNVAPSEGKSILPQEPASSPTMNVREDAVPPLHDDPSMVAPGEERGYNESRVDQPRVHPSADDMIYNEMSRSLNMGGQAADHVAPDAASRPKLTGTEAAQYLRDQYGSDKAARMLYGTSREGSELTEAGRKAAVVRQTAPGPYPLPAAARATIDQALATMSPEEKAAYAAKAPNPLARAYIESQLAK